MKIGLSADEILKYHELPCDLVHRKKKNKKKTNSLKNLYTCASKNLIISANDSLIELADYAENFATTHDEVKSPIPIKQEPQQQEIEEPESLYDYAKALKKRVNLVCIYDKIYYHNGYCYIPIDKKSIIKLYRKKVDYELHNSSSMSRIKSLYDLLITDPDIEAEDPGNLELCTLANGIFDVKNQQLYPHTPEIITFSFVNANYIPNPSCPHFDRFLAETFDNDKTLIERVWQMLGYILMHTNDGKCFFLMGEAPNSGKSLLGNFISQLFPRKHVSNVALNNFNGRFSLVKLVGAAVNVSLDLPSTKLKPTDISNLKSLTGGDDINVEEKGQPSFSFRNRAKLIFASNFPMRIAEEDEAFWNRLIYIPFNKSISPELQDKTLLNKFINEKDSIVTKALRHAKKLIKNNFVFPSTPEIDRKIAEFKNEPLPTVRNFIEAKCEINSEFIGVALQDLYDEYVNFCYENNFTADAYNAFKAQFAKLAGVKHIKKRFGRPNPISGFSGVKLIQ